MFDLMYQNYYWTHVATKVYTMVQQFLLFILSSAKQIINEIAAVADRQTMAICIHVHLETTSEGKCQKQVVDVIYDIHLKLWRAIKTANTRVTQTTTTFFDN